MNAAHIISKKRNRLSRCEKRLSDKELVGSQRNAIEQRLSDLKRELSSK